MPWIRLVWLGVAIVATGGVSFGCTAVQPVAETSPDREVAYLKLAVEPSSAEVYVDGEYRGEVAGWREGMVPLEPGERRVKVVADGHVPRRFDVDLEAGESKRLEVELEPKLDDFEE